MKLKLTLFLIILLIALPTINAVDTDNWHDITVNNVNFKVPDKYFNESANPIHEKSYYYSNQFSIVSCMEYDTLKNNYGFESTSDGIMEIDQISISGHDAVHIYNNYHSKWGNGSGLNKSYIFFSTGNKIFEISFKGEKINSEIKEIIKSTPKPNMSEEIFLNKLDNAQRDYIQEDYEKNLELDMEDYYRTYNEEHNHESFYYFGTNGFGVGGSTRWWNKLFKPNHI